MQKVSNVKAFKKYGIFKDKQVIIFQWEIINALF